MNAIRPAQLIPCIIDVQPLTWIGKRRVNDLTSDFCEPGSFKLCRTRQLKKQDTRAPSLDRRNKCAILMTFVRTAASNLPRSTVAAPDLHRDSIIEIAGRLVEQLIQRIGNLCMIERCMNPIFIGRDSGSDRPKKQRPRLVRL